MIWLAASRSGRLVTAAGVVAWVIAMFIHSIHDGILTLFTNPSTAGLSLPTVSEALATAAALFLLELIVTILLYLLCRHAAREVTPPDSVPFNSPHWRPTIKAWGVRKHQTDPTTAS